MSKRKAKVAKDAAPKGMKMARSRRHDVAPTIPTFEQRHPVAPRPPGAPEMAMDNALAPSFDFANSFVGYGYDGGNAWPGFPYLAELAQRPEYRMITEVRAKEMTRKGFEIVYNGDKDGGDEKIKAIEAGCKEFGVNDRLRISAEHDGFFGGGQIYIDVCDFNDTAEIAKPLTISSAKIPKGGLRGFKNIEAMWSYPGPYNSANPLAPDYFTPSQWYVNSTTVHATRLLTMISRVMPDILKPQYSFRGLSLSQMAFPYVNNWLRTRQSVSDIVHSFSIVAILSNLQGQLGGEGWDNIYSRVDEFNALRDNRGAFVLDKETEDIKIVTAALSGLDALQAQAQEQMASVSQTPLVKLLGIQPAGLNASSDGEIRVFYDTIHALQEHLFSGPLKVMLECIQLHLFGEIDPDIGHRFVPLWQLDEAAIASVRKTEADTDAVYLGEGVISNEEVRTRLANQPESQYAGLDLDSTPPPELEPPEGDPESTSGDPAKSAEPKEQERSGV